MSPVISTSPRVSAQACLLNEGAGTRGVGWKHQSYYDVVHCGVLLAVLEYSILHSTTITCWHLWLLTPGALGGPLGPSPTICRPCTMQGLRGQAWPRQEPTAQMHPGPWGDSSLVVAELQSPETFSHTSRRVFSIDVLNLIRFQNVEKDFFTAGEHPVSQGKQINMPVSPTKSEQMTTGGFRAETPQASSLPRRST